MTSQQAIAIVLFLTALCSYANYKFIRLPKSIGITLVALVISAVINILSIPFANLNDYAVELQKNLGFNQNFLHGMLSFLLFAAALQISPQDLSKHRFTIASFATISVIISTFLIGAATFVIGNLCGLILPFYYCFIFGALISPTDAITVTNILRDTPISSNLHLKISGEALFNDGMAIVLFIMALALAHGEQRALSLIDIFFYFLRQGVGGIAFGVILGWITNLIFKDIEDSDLIIMLTLVLVTGGYLVATSFIMVSGPISIAVAGLLIGSEFKRRESVHPSLKKVSDFWIILDELLNAILFVLIGIEFIWVDITWPIAISSIAVVFITLAARWISIYIPEALLTRKAINFRTISLITWSGLRGGISIALALGLTGPYSEEIVAITYFVVLFSIIVQGLTLKPLIREMAFT